MSDIIYNKAVEALAKGGIRFFFKPSRAKTDWGKMLSGQDIFYPPESHFHVEMILKCSGYCRIFINGKWLELVDNELWIFTPGTVHTESYIAKDIPYEMFWISLVPQAVIFHRTGYDPFGGFFDIKSRVNMRTPFNDQLWEFVHHEELFSDKIEQIRFQALLLMLMFYICDNEEALTSSADEHHKQVVNQIRYYIDNYYWKDISLDTLAAMVYYSPGHLNALFKEYVGLPVYQYLLRRRLRQAKKLLSEGRSLIKDAAQAVGIHDSLYFSRLFKKHEGISPQEFINNQRHS